MSVFLSLAIRYWKPLAIILLLAGAVAYVNYQKAASYRNGVAAQQQADAAGLLKAEQDRKLTEDAWRARFDSAALEYAANGRALQDRISGLNRAHAAPIRLCNSAHSSAMPDAAGSSSTVTAAASGDRSDMRAGADLGPALLVYAGKCEQDRQAVIALQGLLKSER